MLVIVGLCVAGGLVLRGGLGGALPVGLVQASLLRARPRGVQPVFGHLQQEARARALPAHPVGRPARIAAPARVRRVHGEHRHGGRLDRTRPCSVPYVQKSQAEQLRRELFARKQYATSVQEARRRRGRRRCRGGCERVALPAGGRAGRAGGGRGICRSGAPQCAGRSGRAYGTDVRGVFGGSARRYGQGDLRVRHDQQGARVHRPVEQHGVRARAYRHRRRA